MALAYVDHAFGITDAGDGYTTMPITIPAGRAVGDLMIVGVGSHSGNVFLPSGFTQIHSPSGGFVVGYQVSASSGSGTITATSSGGSFGSAWLLLIRGYDPAVHAIVADGVRYASVGSGFAVPGLTERGNAESLQLLTAFRRFGAFSWSLDPSENSIGATPRWGYADNWGSALWTRPSITAESVTINSSASASEAAGWNIFIYAPVDRRPVVGFIGWIGGDPFVPPPPVIERTLEDGTTRHLEDGVTPRTLE